MDYPTEGGTIYDMLSCNNVGRGNYKNKTGSHYPCFINHAFHSADENFCVIDKSTRPVVVLYGEAESLIEKYRNQCININTKNKLGIIKTLEKYSVSLYSWEREKLAVAITGLDKETGIEILSQNHYSAEIGIILETDPIDYMI